MRRLGFLQWLLIGVDRAIDQIDEDPGMKPFLRSGVPQAEPPSGTPP